MNLISDTELYGVFPRNLPDDLVQLARTTEEESPYDTEARVETEKLRGKRWEDVKSELFQQCYDLPLLLSPPAFHYYFPAFIKQSQINISQLGLFVDTILNLLADTEVHWPEALSRIEESFLKENPEIQEAVQSIDMEGLSAWREERWRLFTKEQWLVVQKWLIWMKRHAECDVNQSVLQKALGNIDMWLKGNVGR
jgi:hypothetical protein